MLNLADGDDVKSGRREASLTVADIL